VIPYADFTYFGVLLLYVVVPTLILGVFGRAGWRWALFVTALMLGIQYCGVLQIRPELPVRELWILAGFAIWQWATVRVFAALGARAGWLFYGAIALSALPLLATKLFPVIWPGTQFGFLGISYVTFRALDLVFCLRDKVITAPGALDLFMFLFFFPTISSGPIDRYRRFGPEWRRRRTRAEFLADLDAAVHRLFRGFLYKFIVAALIQQYWLEPAASSGSFRALLSYMYGYSFYLFFDFAGYSAFAIALSYLFGVHTPENFNRPFLARNIRDFWNRWHITLSFWFRDHVFMRFVLAAARGRWFASKNTAAVLGYFLAFGLMGFWHGIEPHYIIYGFYQAMLLAGFHVYSSWKQPQRSRRGAPLRHALAVFVTFNFVCFGLLIFSGRIGAPPKPHHFSELEHAACSELYGWVWDKQRPNSVVDVDLWDGERLLVTFSADEFRQDLAEAGYGTGRHAFYIHPPNSIRDGRPHEIHLRIAGTKTELKNSPQVLVCH
jgi:membrane protein involved in D-alanine export